MTELNFKVDANAINPLVLAQAYVEVLQDKIDSYKKIVSKINETHTPASKVSICRVCKTVYPCKTVLIVNGEIEA